MALRIGLESDVPGGHIAVIEINIDAIGARRDLLAFFKSRQVCHRRWIVSQKAGVKIEVRLRGERL